ncbi:putative protein isoform X1 [Capsicum galapagoense]
MAECSTPKRITHGISSDQLSNDDCPSFGLCIFTQDTDNAGAVTLGKSKDLGEDTINRSVKKSIHYTKENGKRIVGDIPSTKNASKKALEYFVEERPADSPRISCYGKADIAKVLKDKLSETQFAMFQKTCFGVFLETPNCALKPQMIRCLMVLELKQDNVDEFWVLINGTPLRFSIREFATITGLKCTGSTEQFDIPGNTPNRLVDLYFGGENKVKKNDLVQCFMNKRWGDDDKDAVKIALLYFINTFILSIGNSVSIKRKHFHMVENGTYSEYPWGTDAYNQLISTIRHKMTFTQQLYRITGMPFALQVWVYECCSNIKQSFANRVAHRSPRILNWEVNNAELQYAKLMDGIFKDHDNPLVFKNMVSTPEEVEIYPTAQTMVSTTHVQEDFDDFSSKPPKLKKRSLGESGIRLAHPSKKPKQNDHPRVQPHASKKTKRPKTMQDVQAEATAQENEHTPTEPDRIPINRTDQNVIKELPPLRPDVQDEASVLAIEHTTDPEYVPITRKDLNDFKKSVNDQFLNMRLFISEQITMVLKAWALNSQPDSNNNNGRGVDVKAPHSVENQPLNRSADDMIYAPSHVRADAVTTEEISKEINNAEENEELIEGVDHVPVDVNRKGIQVEEGCSNTTKEPIKNVDISDKPTSVQRKRHIMEDVAEVPNNKQFGSKQMPKPMNIAPVCMTSAQPMNIAPVSMVSAQEFSFDRFELADSQLPSQIPETRSQSFTKSLPEQHSSHQTGHRGNNTSSAQAFAKLIFECSMRLPLEAVAHDPTNETEMSGAIAALNENPSPLFNEEQANQLLKLKYEFPFMVKKWRDLAQDESRYRELLTNFEEDRTNLDNLIKSEKMLKSEYAKREEQARELEALLQTIRTRQKEITEERRKASQEAQKLMLLVQENVGKTQSTSTELETTKMQMDNLRKIWSNFQSKFP